MSKKAVVAAKPSATAAPGKATEETLEIGDVDPIDEFCLASIFDEATTFLSSESAAQLKLTNEQKLRFYALFKQATVGPCNVPKPGMLEFVAKAKWQAWKDIGAGMSKDSAVATYVAELEKIAPSWQAMAEKAAAAGGKDKKDQKSAPANGGGGGGGGGGDLNIAPSTSRPVYDDPLGEITDKEKTITYFASVNDLKSVRAAIAKGVSINTTDSEGRTALHWAADRGHTDLALVLIKEFKADLNVKDAEGQTPLHFACTCEYVPLASALLAAGADRNIADATDETPASIASSSSDKNLRKLFAAASTATATATTTAAAPATAATATAASAKK